MLYFGKLSNIRSNFSEKLSFESLLYSSLGECAFRTMILLHQRPLRTVCDILSPTNSIILAADNYSVLYKIFYSQLIIFVSFSIETNINPLLLLCPFVPHNLLYTPLILIYILLIPFAAFVIDPELYRPLTIHVPNLMSFFHCLCRSKGSVQARGTRNTFRNQASF